ncbi:MAG: hypothetical protein JW779_16480 [Candidatus Thorarchaeota archaeon]|nr:hypothetical protein [Candidatus Thorarchaeota archaeon]
MEPNQVARRLGMTLIVWSTLSIIIGVLLLFLPTAFFQGIGLQGILWGIIDLIIALVGVLRNKEESPEKMARILLINVALDGIYQFVGLLLIVFFLADAFIVGNGLGVIIQGAFLFILDFYYYRRFKMMPAE